MKLYVNAGVRYWEDATVDGVVDDEGTLIPFRDPEENAWKPVIDIETGKIIGWPLGTTAKIHYKVCDDGHYIIKDDDGTEVYKTGYYSYVPQILRPNGDTDSDYIILIVNADGTIQDFKFVEKGFQCSN